MTQSLLSPISVTDVEVVAHDLASGMAKWEASEDSGRSTELRWVYWESCAGQCDL